MASAISKTTGPTERRQRQAMPLLQFRSMAPSSFRFDLLIGHRNRFPVSMDTKLGPLQMEWERFAGVMPAKRSHSICKGPSFVSIDTGKRFLCPISRSKRNELGAMDRNCSSGIACRCRRSVGPVVFEIAEAILDARLLHSAGPCVYSWCGHAPSLPGIHYTGLLDDDGPEQIRGGRVYCDHGPNHYTFPPAAEADTGTHFIADGTHGRPYVRLAISRAGV